MRPAETDAKVVRISRFTKWQNKPRGKNFSHLVWRINIKHYLCVVNVLVSMSNKQTTKQCESTVW